MLCFCLKYGLVLEVGIRNSFPVATCLCSNCTSKQKSARDRFPCSMLSVHDLNHLGEGDGVEATS